jgi:hypothetical protein
MRRQRIVACAFAVLSVTAAEAMSQTPARLYEMIEESMTHPKPASYDNPFTDAELRLQVEAPDDRELGSEFRWYGFHDGDGKGGQDGNVWKFRLLLDTPGTWEVTAGFYKPGTDTRNGPERSFTYEVSEERIRPNEHGHVRVDPRNPMRFAFDDGTPWVPVSVHASMLLDRDDFDVVKQWIDEHTRRGIDTLGVRFHAEGDNHQNRFGDVRHIHYLGADGKRSTTGKDLDFTRFDVATWRHYEKAVDYAQQRGVRLFIWFGVSAINEQYHAYGPRDHTNTDIGPRQKQLIRYFLARWAPYTSWWHWTVCSEWNERRASKEAQIEFALALRDQNPWRTMISNHSLGDWELNGKEDGWDLATLQKRIGDNDASTIEGSKRIVENNDDHGIPVFNEEGVWCLNAQRTRIATLSHLFAGGYSHFATWIKEDKTTSSSWHTDWNTVTSAHKEALPALGRLNRYFNRPDIDINAGKPAHDLVSIEGDGPAKCLAAPGDQYYLWISKGGAVSLDLSDADGTYEAVRYRGDDLPADDGGTTLGTFAGGKVADLGVTPKTGYGNDYVIVVKRIDAGR